MREGAQLFDLTQLVVVQVEDEYVFRRVDVALGGGAD